LIGKEIFFYMSNTEITRDLNLGKLMLQSGTFGETWYELGRCIVDVYSRLMFHLKIHYKAALPAGPKILAVNHPSTDDPILLTLVTPEQMSVLITERLFKLPICGPSLRLTHHIEVPLENGRPALEAGLKALKEGRTVGIFPEGTISPLGGGCCKAHTGVGRLALGSGAPVIPVGIALEPSRLWCRDTIVDGKSDMAAWYISGPYAITVGEPLTFSGNPEDRCQVRAVTDQVMEHVMALASESARRIHLAQIQKRCPVQPIEASLIFRVMRFLLNPV
jgi:1-acyl-sn-glycerol-3-phosphate acyltransferase